jgi:hypothetical protein
MKDACQNLTSSNEINKEIGTKFVKIKTHDPVKVTKISP